MTASNLIEQNDPVLVINSGKFGDWFAECFHVYGAQVTHLNCPFGEYPSMESLEQALVNGCQVTGKPFKLVSITHVDTSTGVLAPVKTICNLVKKHSPESLISLDGVCSIASEEMKMDEWGIDVAMTASQKGLGVPPGLAVLCVSQRALVKHHFRFPSIMTFIHIQMISTECSSESQIPTIFLLLSIQEMVANHESL